MDHKVAAKKMNLKLGSMNPPSGDENVVRQPSV